MSSNEMKMRRIDELADRYLRGDLGPDGFAKAVVSVLANKNPSDDFSVESPGSHGATGVPAFWGHSRTAPM